MERDMQQNDCSADVVTPPTYSFDTEAEIDEVILRLDLTLVQPDDDLPRQQTTDVATSRDCQDDTATHRTLPNIVVIIA